MATEIDRRVVEMQFDNRDFEKNCKQSLSTLEKLKMALNFDGAKGLKDVGEAAKKVDLSQISKSAEKVQVSFSAMQIAGMTAISELTKSLMNFGKNIWNNTFGQIKKGGMARTLKIDQANFQMKALANNFDEIAGDAEKLATFMTQMGTAIDNAVTGTAYGYDAAASVASQLMASGLKNAKQMETDLRAIAGAAAMTGRSYEDIGNIFTTVASNGRLMTMQLRQFSAAGLNMSSVLAKHFETTEAEINDMVTKGKVSYREFADAINEQFGEAAGKADETWSGVTANVKAQLSRIGQNFTDPFVKHLIPTLGNLKQLIKDINTDAIKPLKTTWEMVVSKWSTRLGDWLKSIDTKRLRTISEALENIFVTIIGIAESIRAAFREVFPAKTADQLQESAQAFLELSKNLIPTKETMEGLKTLFVALLTPARLAFNIFRSLTTGAAKPLGLALLRIVGAVLRLVQAFEPLINTLMKVVSESMIFDNIINFISNTLVLLLDIITAVVSAVAEVFSEANNSGAMKQLLDGLKSIADVLEAGVYYALIGILWVISKILSVFNIDNIVAVFNNIGAVIGYVIDLVLAGIGSIYSAFQQLSQSGGVIGSILGVLTSIGNLIGAIFTGDDLTDEIEGVKNALGSLGEALKDLFGKIKAALSEINVGKLMLIAFGIAIVFLIFSVKNLIDASTRLVNSVGGTVGILNKIKNAFLGIGRISPIAQMLFALALAVGTVTMSLLALADVDSEKLKVAAASLGAIVGALMGFSIAMVIVTNKAGGGLAMGLKQFVGLMIAVAGSIWMLSNALKTLTEVSFNWSQFWEPLLGVIALIGALSVAIIAMNSLSAGTAINTGAITILAFALSIKIFAKVLKEIAEIDLDNKIINVLLGLGTVIGLMLGLAKAMSMLGGYSKTIFKGEHVSKVSETGMSGAGSIIGMAASLLVLVLVLKKLAEQPVKQIFDGLVRLAMIFVPILLVLKYISKINSAAEGGSLKGAFGLLMGLNALIVIMSITAVLLGGMNVAELAVGIVAINFFTKIISTFLTKLMGAMSILKGRTKDALEGMKYVNKVLIGLGITMVLIALAVKIMDGVNPLAMLAAAGILALLGQVCTWMLKVSKDTKGVKVGPILAMVGAIAAIMAGLAILSFQDPLNLITAGAALGIAMVCLGLMVKLMSSKEMKKITKSDSTKKDIKKGVLTILSLAILIAGIASCMSLIIGTLGRGNVDFSDKDLQVNLGALLVSTALVIGLAFVIYKLLGKLFSVTEDEKKVNDRLMMLLSFVGMITILAGVITAMSVAASTITSPGAMAAAGAALFMAIGGIALVILALGEIQPDKAKHVQQMGKLVVTLCASLLIIAAAIIPLAAIMTYSDITFLSIIGSVIALVAVLAAITAAMVYLSKASGKMKPEQIKALGVTMVIASSSLAIIAAAIAGLSVVMHSNLTSSESNLGAFIALGVIATVLFGCMALIVAASNKNKKNDASKLKAVGVSMVLAAAALAIIAAAISGLVIVFGKAKDVKGVAAVIGAFSVVVLAMMLIMALICSKSKDIDAGKLILAGAAFAILAGSVSIMALAIGAMMQMAENTDLGKLKKMQETLVLMVVIITVLTLVAGLIAAFGPGGGLAVSIMLGMAGAFAIFAGGVFILASACAMFSSAVDTIINDIYKLNKMSIDYDKMKSNLKDVKELIPYFADVFGEILAGVGKIIHDLSLNFIDYGVEMMLGLCRGLEKSLPDLLKSLTKILQDIADWLLSDETLKMFEDLFYAIGRVLFRVIKGVLKGLFEEVNAWIDEIQDKSLTQEQKIAKSMGHSTSMLQNQSKFLTMYGTADLANRAENSYKQIQSLWKKYSDENAKGIWANEYEKALALAEYNKELENTLILYQDLSDEEKASIENAGKVRRARGVSDKQVMEEINNSVKIMGEEFGWSEDRMKKYAMNMAMLNGIGKNVVETSKELVDGFHEIGESSEETSTKLEEDFDAINEKIDETTEATKKAKEEIKEGNVFQGLLDKGSELFGGAGGLWEKLKSGASNGAEGLKGVFGEIGSSLGDKFGGGFNLGALGNIDLSNFAENIKNGSINAGTIAGWLGGKAEAESYELSLDYWKKKSKQKISSMGAPSAVMEANKSAFDKVGKEAWTTWTDEEGNYYKTREEAEKGMLEQAKKNAEAYSDAANALNAWGYEFPDVTKAAGDLEIGLDSLGGKTDDTKSKFEDFTDSLRDSVKDALSNIFDDPGEFEIIDPDTILDNMWENIRRVGQWSRQIQELARRGISEPLLNELKEMGPAGAEKVDAFARMTAEQLQQANRLYQGKMVMPDMITRDITKSYAEAGFNASLGFANGIDPNAANEAMIGLANSGLDALTSPEGLDENSPSKKTYKIGEYATEGLAKGVGSAKSQNSVYSNSVRTAQQVIKGFETWVSASKALDLARYFCQGLSDGFTKYGQPVVAKASAVAAAIVTSFVNRFKIGSPSRVMYDIGEYIMEGLGYGIDDGSTFVERQTGQTADAILDSMKENMAMSLDGLGEDGVYSPVIRPIFDMSLMGEGWNDITSWFNNGQTIDLNSNIARLTPTGRDDTSNNEAVINAIRSLDVSGVKNEIQSMRNDISNLEAAMSNLKVVMNTGALVGQLMNPMDAAMGQKAMLNSRGRY